MSGVTEDEQLMAKERDGGESWISTCPGERAEVRITDLSVSKDCSRTFSNDSKFLEAHHLQADINNCL